MFIGSLYFIDLLFKNLMDNQKTYIEELKEKESSYGKIFKVSGPRKNLVLCSCGCWKDGWV